MRKRSFRGLQLLLGSIALLSVFQAKADVWSGAVNLVAVEPEDAGGTLLFS